MANKTRLQIAKKDIIVFFSQREQRVYRERELEQLLAQQRDGWRLAAGTRVRGFLDLMLGATPLRPVVVQAGGQPKTYYTWGEVTAFELGSHLVPRAFLSHYSALYLHGLTEQIPKQIFVNQEQSARQLVSQPALTQAELTEAYARPVKLTSPSAFHGEYAFVQLHGRFTGQLGVVTQEHFAAGRVSLTGLERTLLDVTVRPEYAGGIYQVQEAYRLAAGRVSINRLLGLLTKLNYRYPYHQAVGLYLERAGAYKASQVQLVRKFRPATLDFYLAHELIKPAYDAQWRVYYPAHF